MTIFYLAYALMALIGYGYTDQVIAFNSPTRERKIISFIWSLGNLILRSYIITVLWQWFVSSNFPQIPIINIYTAMGFNYLSSLFILAKPMSVTDFKVESIKDLTEDKAMIYNDVFYTIKYLYVWGISAIIHYLSLYL